MLPNRTNDTIRQVLAAGVAALVATAATFTTLNSTTLKVGSNGATMDGSYRTTLTVDPASIALGSSTTSAVTLTGAVAGDHCSAVATSGDLALATTTVRLTCVTATDSVTVNYFNASSTAAVNPGSSVISIKADSY